MYLSEISSHTTFLMQKDVFAYFKIKFNVRSFMVRLGLFTVKVSWRLNMSCIVLQSYLTKHIQHNNTLKCKHIKWSQFYTIFPTFKPPTSKMRLGTSKANLMYFLTRLGKTYLKERIGQILMSLLHNISNVKTTYFQDAFT